MAPGGMLAHIVAPCNRVKPFIPSFGWEQPVFSSARQHVLAWTHVPQHFPPRSALSRALGLRLQ